mmetsp:Transcript_50851/g.110896  ORF Transcript_50851/g.110896 Transcript_50851/m.110896 type:complete len:106 (-) Transcript_50851:411-728(-)
MVMAPAPNRLDSVEVTNNSGGPVEVTVTFDDHKDKKEIQDSRQLGPGETFHFAEKMLDMGSWQAVAPVIKVSVTHGNGSHTLAPSITGVVKKLSMSVGADGQLAQ